MNHTFVNLTNHPSARWSDTQRLAALEYGPIQDLPFPAISAHDTLEYISRLAAVYLEKLKAIENPVVLIQGEAVFTYELVRLLEQTGIPALAAVSSRQAQETILRDGTTQKTAYFVFEGFRPYWIFRT